MSSKNTSPFAGRFVCFSWHPAPAGSSDILPIALFALPRIFRITPRSVRSFPERRQATRWQHGQPWFYLRLASGAALWLCWVVRGSIRWPMRLLRLSRPGYLPSNPCAQLSDLERQPGRSVPWWCALYAACSFRCSASNVSPFFHRIRAIAAILRASVSRAMAGSIPLATLLS